MFKKIVSIALMLVVLASAFVMAEDAAQVIELGTSGFVMTIDASYAKGEISTEDTDESQVAYYASEVYAVDFDVYQWAVAADETLNEVADAEAAEYDSTCENIVINGIEIFVYEAVEESEGVEYTTVNCIMQNGNVFAEIVFWMDGEGAAELIDAMINTIAVVDDAEIADEGNVITLGTSSLKITLPYVYEKGDITAEDTDESQVAYYSSEETTVDFDVYQWAKAENETLEDVITAEAAEFDAEAAETVVNGITVAYYNAVEEYEGVVYNTVTFIAEDGDDFVEIVFWLDGENATEVVDAIIGSIAR